MKKENGLTKDTIRELMQSDLASVVKPIRGDLQLMDKELREQIQQIKGDSLLHYEPWLKRPVEHFFHVKGKYLRPTMLFLCARALDPSNSRKKSALIQTASAIELMHSASLVHDDIIDEADSRRGAPSVNASYGNKIAVLVGDLLYARFFSIATHLEAVEYPQQLQLFELFSSTTQKMCLGEILEERLQKLPEEVSFQDYFSMIEHKTGSLMAASCEAAGILLDAEPERCGALARYGMNLGLSYQIVDDVIYVDSVYSNTDAMLEKAVALGNRAIDDIKAAIAVGDGRPSAHAAQEPVSAAQSLARLVEYILQKAEKLLQKAIA
jgi:geranylgeranyl pyrophosphate synthase